MESAEKASNNMKKWLLDEDERVRGTKGIALCDEEATCDEEDEKCQLDFQKEKDVDGVIKIVRKRDNDHDFLFRAIVKKGTQVSTVCRCLETE
jgi:hypothetical protein